MREKKGHKQLKYIRSQRMATEDRFQVQTKWSKMSSVQRAEAAFCLGIYFVQGGLLPPSPAQPETLQNFVTLHNKTKRTLSAEQHFARSSEVKTSHK